MKGFSGFKESPMKITSIDYESQFGGGNPNLQVTNTTMAPEPEPEPEPTPEPTPQANPRLAAALGRMNPKQRQMFAQRLQAMRPQGFGGSGQFQGVMANRVGRRSTFAPMSKKFGTKQGAFMLPEKSIIEK